MTKGATVIVSLALVWGAGCGTHSAIGNLNVGGGGGHEGPGGIGAGGSGMGGGDQGAVGGSGVGGSPGIGGSGIGGNPGIGGSGVGGAGAGRCPIHDAGPPPSGNAKTFAIQTPVDYPTGAGAFAVAAGDLNGDGKLDLVLLDVTVGLRVLFNNGNGTFTGPIDKTTNTTPTAVALGDLNGDQKIDIATVSFNGVSVYINQGNGNFAPAVTYVAGSQSVALALGDLDRDGRVDMAVANLGDNSTPGDVGMLLNTGGGTFSVTTLPGTPYPTSIAIGDLTDDCNLDLVVGGANGLTVLRGDSHQPTTYGSGTSPTSLAIGDINGDGRLDLVENGSYPAVYVLLNYGDGKFTAPVRYTQLDTPDASCVGGSVGRTMASLGDMNGDGNNDVLTSSCYGLGVFLNHGDGTFAPAINYPVPAGAVSHAYGDFNGDGLGDVAVVGFSNGSDLRVLLNASH